MQGAYPIGHALLSQEPFFRTLLGGRGSGRNGAC